MTERPVFPPLLCGLAAQPLADPFYVACAQAGAGVDAGLIVHSVGADSLKAAIILAPDVPLAEAMVMFPVCGIGFQNALGALAPPEVAVHLDWTGPIRLNGAKCGKMRAAAASVDGNAVPDWLVIGFEVAVMPIGDNPGDTPDMTSLYEEGCAEIDPMQLLESWARHTLVWINRWGDGEVRNIHNEWVGLVHGIGSQVQMAGVNGTFIGVDEQFGMLLKQDDDTRLLPLTTLLETGL